MSVAFVETSDGVRIHVETEGEGPPVTVLAHGLTNSCSELAAFTPMVPGTKVRFCFRGHGHSDVPEAGYRFADFARDLDVVASEYGATAAVGTSLGAGAIMHLLADRPDRFERLVFLLPAGLDVPFPYKERVRHTADLLEGKTREEAIAAVLADREAAGIYSQSPWLRELDLALWADLNPKGVARAIREVIEDWPVRDRELLRRVRAPILLICREGDAIHPAELGRILHELMPNSELLVFEAEVAMVNAIPALVERVAAFLRAA